VSKLLVLVGEAPGGTGEAKQPALDPSGYTGRRLARMMRLTDEEYLDHTARYNIFDVPADGLKWNRVDAYQNARKLRESFPLMSRVVLLGSKVADVFGMNEIPMFHWYATSGGIGKYHFTARVPHPSGRNRMLNDPMVVSRMSTFLQEALELE